MPRAGEWRHKWLFPARAIASAEITDRRSARFTGGRSAGVGRRRSRNARRVGCGPRTSARRSPSTEVLRRPRRAVSHYSRRRQVRCAESTTSWRRWDRQSHIGRSRSRTVAPCAEKEAPSHGRSDAMTTLPSCSTRNENSHCPVAGWKSKATTCTLSVPTSSSRTNPRR